MKININNISHKSNFIERTKFTLPVALLIVLSIFIFAPATIYYNNIDEFTFGLLEILKAYSLPMVIMLSVVLAIGFLIPRKLIALYCSALAAFGFLYWLQGNFLLWDYGVFDGLLIDWETYTWQGWLDTGLWIAVFSAALIFHKKIFRLTTFLCFALIAVQAAALIVTSFSYNHSFWKKEPDLTFKVPDSITNYSSNFNIIHIVLDHFQTDIFLEIVDEESLWNEFEGFTVYKENMANAPSTTLSIPAMFSGDIYDGSISVSEYCQEVFTRKSFNNILFEQGFVVNMVPYSILPDTSYSNMYRVPAAYGGSIDEELLLESTQIIDVALFRHLPQVIKYFIYNDNHWFISRYFSLSPSSRIISDLNFFKDYLSNIAISNDNPAYHYMHLLPPHPPYVLDQRGRYNIGLDQNRDNYKNQAKYTLKLFLEFLEKLKEMDIYKNSFIILSSDHGSEFSPIIDNRIVELDLNRVPALLAIKLPNDKGKLEISNVQTMISDIPATVMDILDLEHNYTGQSILTIGELDNRERKFINPYREDGTVDNYLVVGSIFDNASWKSTGSTSLTTIPAINYQWGEVVTFGFLGNAEDFQGSGWSIPASGHLWNNGYQASLIFPVDPPLGDIELTASFMPFLHDEEVLSQRVVILINGESLGDWLIEEQGLQQKKIIIPKNRITTTPINLTFQFPDAVSPMEMNISNDARTLALAMASIVLDEKP